LRKVDCVRIPVPDLETGLAFYGDRLGHELIWRMETAAGLRLPESDVEIVIYTDPEGMEVDFLVDSTDDAIGTFERAGGRLVAPPFDIPIGRCSLVEDPFGNRFVLLDMSKGPLTTDDTGNVVRTREPEDSAGRAIGT
jgi:predicted enzyme related to lactoylglutathione lyase